MYVHLKYKLESLDIQNDTLKTIHNENIKCLWGFKMLYTNKETLYRDGKRRGLGLTHPPRIRNTNILNRFNEIKEEPKIA
jgi:hypothetical protein